MALQDHVSRAFTRLSMFGFVSRRTDPIRRFGPSAKITKSKTQFYGFRSKQTELASTTSAQVSVGEQKCEVNASSVGVNRTS